MKSSTRRGLAVFGLAAAMMAGVLLDRAVLAQQGALKRTILLRTDDPGCGAYEAVLGIAELPPGSSSGKHRHPGVEIGYVLEGSIVLEHEGRPTATLKTGDSVKNDGVHSATNSGSQTAKVLACTSSRRESPSPSRSPDGRVSPWLPGAGLFAALCLGTRVLECARG